MMALAGGTACPKADKQWHILVVLTHLPQLLAWVEPVCHCFGVLAEAVLLTLRGANGGSGWGHCLSQSGQAVAHPDWLTGKPANAAPFAKPSARLTSRDWNQ